MRICGICKTPMSATGGPVSDVVYACPNKSDHKLLAKSNFAHRLSELVEEYNKTTDCEESFIKGEEYFAGFANWLKEYK